MAAHLHSICNLGPKASVDSCLTAWLREINDIKSYLDMRQTEEKRLNPKGCLRYSVSHVGDDLDGILKAILKPPLLAKVSDDGELPVSVTPGTEDYRGLYDALSFNNEREETDESMWKPKADQKVGRECLRHFIGVPELGKAVDARVPYTGMLFSRLNDIEESLF